jgi:hypothetical protein
MDELQKKKIVLGELLRNYNDGRMKNYYCIAVNLLPMMELEKIMKKARKIVRGENIGLVR